MKKIVDILIYCFILVLFVATWPVSLPLAIIVLVGVAITNQFPTGD